VKATKAARDRHYVDLFAGPGQNRIKPSLEIVDGSPLIALKAGPPAFTKLFLADVKPRNVRLLEAHKADFPSRSVTVLEGDANQRVDDVLVALPRSAPALAFLTPVVLSYTGKLSGNSRDTSSPQSERSNYSSSLPTTWDSLV
jgi:three-Cys-motif partner protein